MRIALVGDIAFVGQYNKADKFKEVGEYLSSFDYVVGNLESPFSKEKKKWGSKSAYLCTDPENIDLLKNLHINAVNLANNHIFDYGKEGYETTKKLLIDSGIEWFGTEGKVLKINLHGNAIAFSGFCCFSSNPLKCVSETGYGVNAYNLNCVKKNLKKNNAEGYLNIMSVHAGIEHVNYPSLDHIRAARMLADICPYVYYGHHPHVIQGIEEYKKSLVAHSLGNFCFDDVYTEASTKKPLVEMSENNRQGMILELTIDNNQILHWFEQVIYIGREKIMLVKNPTCINEYNKSLVDCEINSVEYELFRRQIIDERLWERKKMRNLSWFLKRIKPRYIKLIMNARKNSILYRKSIKNYL